jgi:hypothetical protein
MIDGKSNEKGLQSQSFFLPHEKEKEKNPTQQEKR